MLASNSQIPVDASCGVLQKAAILSVYRIRQGPQTPETGNHSIHFLLPLKQKHYKHRYSSHRKKIKKSYLAKAFLEQEQQQKALFNHIITILNASNLD